MEHKKGTLILWIFVLILAVIVFASIMSRIYSMPPLVVKAQDGTSVNSRFLTREKWEKKMSTSYPELYNVLADDTTNSFVIPGLMSTTSIAVRGKNKGEVGICENMTPQGIAVTENYMIVSAYSSNQSFDSVLYLMDKETGRYLKTVVLLGTSHVGGIAYCPKSDSLWITTNDGDGKGKAELSMITMADIEEYNLQKLKAPISYNLQVTLDDLEAASSVTYYKNMLIVGYFSREIYADVRVYTLTKDNILRFSHEQIEEDELDKSDTSLYSGLDRVQGILFGDEYVFFSQSYGIPDSELVIMKNAGFGQWTGFGRDETIGRLNCPPYMEQIASDGKYLYMIFEAAADKYDGRPVTIHMDRIIKVDIHKLVNSSAVWEEE